MQHTWNLVPDIRELPPVDGWRQYESTGTARFTCSCGQDSGHIPTREAAAIAQQHMGLTA